MRNRRYERRAMTAELTIQPGDEKPAHWQAKVYNVSRGGLAVFSSRAYDPGKMVGLELLLPGGPGGVQKVSLFGVTRWIEMQADGNLLGIELLCDPRAGDYRLFQEYIDHVPSSAPCGGGTRGGFTLVEVCITMTIVCLMVTMAVPSFRRAIEQARLDAATANLKTIWSAQRLYWLQYRQFSPQLSGLQSMDLIDSATAASASDPQAVYAYQVSSADAYSFVVRAVRNNTSWVGQLQIDQQGRVCGAVAGPDNQVLTASP